MEFGFFCLGEVPFGSVVGRGMGNTVFQLVKFLDEMVDGSVCGGRWLPRTFSLGIRDFSVPFLVAFVVKVIVCLDFFGQIVNHFSSVRGFGKARWNKGKAFVECVPGGVVEHLGREIDDSLGVEALLVLSEESSHLCGAG